MCRRSFRRFLAEAWATVPRLPPLVPSAHVDAICQHLEAVARGDIRFLLINMPPRQGKSELVGIFWLPWVWTWRPTWQAIYSGHVDKLVVRDSVRCRELIESMWYQDTFVRGAWELRDDSNRKNDFSNTLGGRRLSTSVTGSTIGEGGDVIVADDPQDPDGVHSEAERKRVVEWWDGTMSSRLNDAEHGAKVVVQQRLHSDDLSAHLISSGRYTHLNLPTRFNPKKRCVTTVRGAEFWRDRREQDGELLNPLRFGLTAVEEALTPGVGMGPRKFKAQHDQDPDSDQGGEFKKAFWRFWRPDGTSPEFRCRRPEGCVSSEDYPAIPLPDKLSKLLSVDTTFKDKKHNDWVVSVVIGWSGAHVFVLDRVRRHMTSTETVETIKRQCEAYPDLRQKLIEDTANGPAILQEFQAVIPGLMGVTPKGSKQARASACLPRVEAGQVFLPEGAAWLEEWVEEFGAFPEGKHDDQVDAFTQGILHLGRDAGLLARARAMGKR